MASSLFSFKKFSFKVAEFETEFEVDEKYKPSFIDFYRMEIVEALTRCAKRFDYTVVFEDMDRLKYKECISLFTKLREINRLVNLTTTKSRSAKKTVRFIYVIHDAVFNIGGETNHDKAGNKVDYYQLNHLKFFDYILPIIPQILDDAASNYIKSCFENIDFHYIAEFISIVDKEIADYRIIHNIANEYCVIRDTYQEKFAIILSEKDEKYIMALAVYKTLLPWDYQQIRLGKSIFQVQKPIVEDNCISRFIDCRWLCFDCLKYVGLSDFEIEKYIEYLFVSDNFEERIDIVQSVLQEKYLMCRNIIMQKSPFLHGKVIKYVGYSLLSLELTNCKNDLSMLKQMCRESFPTLMRITEMYTCDIRDVLVDYLTEASKLGLDEQIQNATIVFEYLLSFCDSNSNCFEDCQCVISLFFFRCYLKLSEAKKSIMVSNNLMTQCFNKAEAEPAFLNSILELIDGAEAERLLQVNNLNRPVINSLNMIIQNSR